MIMMNFSPSGGALHLLVILLITLIRPSDQAVYSCNASVSCGCSKNSAVVSRIVGGETAGSATWGWAVSLSMGDGYLCGGSIISSSWVLTAAHCMDGFTASQVRVYAGSTRRWAGSQNRLASQIIIHPSYNTETYENDLALVKLTTPFIMTDPNVSQICLPSVSAATLAAGEWPAAGTTVVAVGWGTLTESGSLPSTLQQVTVQTVSYQALTCSPLVNNWRTQLCAGVSGGGKDTCQGDSGGPLMMFTPTNQWVLVGLTSNGIGCAQAAYSGVYTRVAAFLSWISTSTNGAVTVAPSSTSTIVPITTTRSTSTTQSSSTTRTTTSTRSTTTARSTTTTRPTTTTRSTTTTRRTTTTPRRTTTTIRTTTRRWFSWFDLFRRAP